MAESIGVDVTSNAISEIHKTNRDNLWSSFEELRGLREKIEQEGFGE